MEQQLSQNIEQSHHLAQMMHIFDLFKKSFEIYKQKFETLAGLILINFLSIFALLPFLLIYGIVAFIESPEIVSGKFEFNLSFILIGVLLGLIGIIFMIIISLWTQTACIFAIKDKEAKIGIKESLKISWPKIGSFFWINLLRGLAVSGGLILLIIPGIIFSIWFYLAIYVFASEGLRGVAALKRSKQLVKGYWWPVFLRVFIIMVFSIAISQIKFLGFIINIFFTLPFSLIMIYLIYEDLKNINN